MSTAVEQSLLRQGLLIYDELNDVVDERTLAILERRRRTAIVRRRGWLVRRMLLLADVVGLCVAFVAVDVFLQRDGQSSAFQPSQFHLFFFLATLPAWVVIAKLYGLYDHDEERTDHTTPDDSIGVFHMLTVGAWLFLIATRTAGFGAPALPKLVGFWLLSIVLVTTLRAGARAFCRRRITYLQNTVIVGAGAIGQLVAHKFRNHPEYGINLVGFVDAKPRELQPDLEGLTLLGAPDRLPAIIRLLDIERVVFAFWNEPDEVSLDVIRSLKDLDVQIDIVPRMFEVIGSNAGIHTVEGLPLLGLSRLRLSHSSRLLKRPMDLVIATVALVVLAPFLALVAIAIKLDSRGPVFFRQIRRRGGERTFRIYKFRTMVADAERRKREVAHLNQHASGDPRMFKVPDDPRVTPVGRLLRRFSLDELPQLINVVNGEMSLVGPRPLILDEDRFVTDWKRTRLDLKPGITGLWQVLGRSEIPFEEMTKLDYLYVTNWSLWGDLLLLFRTVPTVFRARRAY